MIASQTHGATSIGTRSNHNLNLCANDSTKMTITSTGQLLVGTTSVSNRFKNGNGNGATPKFQFETANVDEQNDLSLTFGRNNAFGAEIILAKHRAATVGGYTIVQSGDRLGGINFAGSDGAHFRPAALIQSRVDGTPTSGHIKGQLEFHTSSGTPAALSEKMRISSEGYVTKPNNAMFKAMRTSNQTVNSNGWVTIQFNTDSATGCFDVGGNFNTSTHRFTAPVTGYYQFGLNQRIDGGDGDYFRVALSVDGDVGASNNYPYGHAIYRDGDGFSYYSFSITALIYLTAGQYVRAEAYAHSDTTWYIQDESIFYGYLVG